MKAIESLHGSIYKLVQRVVGLGIVCMLMVSAAWAQSPEPYVLEFGNRQKTDELRLSIGRSQIINSSQALEQVVIGAPAIADIKLLNSRQVLILGKEPGRTNLAFRGKSGGQVVLMDVVVGYDLTGLKRKLNDVLPNETMVEVRGSNDSVILSGQVSNKLAMETVLEISESFVPENKVVNTMSVGGGHQVMLEVRIAEIQRSGLRELGVGLEGSKNRFSFDTSVGGAVADAFGTFSTVEGPNKYFDSIELTVEALEQKGLAKLLAEPNLVALSGQEASFLAGGEVPIPVDEGTDGISIEFKEFGVGLKFKPVVLSEAKINLKFQSEVSAIDATQSFQIGGGINIPSFVTRRTGTTVEMGDGQSFAVAGLLESNANNLINQYPVLGDIPVLGALFRSTDFQREESELVIIITSRLVKPVVAGSLRNLTDSFIPPSALDQYLLGRLSGGPLIRRTSGHKPMPESQVGLDGEYGHQIAEVF